jgi:hypothetical protein
MIPPESRPDDLVGWGFSRAGGQTGKIAKSDETELLQYELRMGKYRHTHFFLL